MLSLLPGYYGTLRFDIVTFLIYDNLSWSVKTDLLIMCYVLMSASTDFKKWPNNWYLHLQLL